MSSKLFHKSKVIAMLLAIAMIVTSIPIQSVQAASKKSGTVSTQKQLENALKDKNITQVNVKTSKSKTFTIKEGDYSKKKLVIKSPKAKVNNYSQFKSIIIKDVKKYMEYTNNNNIRVEDTKLTLGIEKGGERCKK